MCYNIAARSDPAPEGRVETLDEQKRCVLDETKICDDCGQCNVCDLDPDKICDNCMRCLNTGADYNAIEIDEIIDDGAATEEYECLRKDLLDDDGEPFECFREK